jgi:hypothetical protein
MVATISKSEAVPSKVFPAMLAFYCNIVCRVVTGKPPTGVSVSFIQWNDS